MKSKVNFIDDSFDLCISLKTWVYIMGLINSDCNREHTPFFKRLFSYELSELKQLHDFVPPVRFNYPSYVFFKV